MVLGITAGCKVGTFHLWGAGSGKSLPPRARPPGNETETPALGSALTPRTYKHLAPVSREVILASRTIDSLGLPDARRQVLAVASDK